MNKSNLQYYIYILRNHKGLFYIGITNNLVRRLWEHKEKLVEGFTKKYNVTILVYYEIYQDPQIAIEREKQLKNWTRKKKIELINKSNPTFQEISLETLV